MARRGCGVIPCYRTRRICRKEPSRGPILGRHPWELTLREFIETVRRYYGIEIDIRDAAVVASRSLRKGDRSYVLLIEEDEILSISVLRSLCRFYRIPPEDFGLEADED
jgi:hypothetical protein